MKRKKLVSLIQSRDHTNLEANIAKLYGAKDDVVDIVMENGVNL